jgi:general secretion pathway protein G
LTLPWSAFSNHSCGSNKSRGFTVLELLIVVAVILTIAAIAIPHLVAAIEQARVAKAVGDIRNLEEEIALYNTINNKLPDSLSQVGYGDYLDPWKNPYQYLNNQDMMGNGVVRDDRFMVPLNADYDLYSLGKDGQTASPISAVTSQDDVIRVGSAGFIGPVSQF